MRPREGYLAGVVRAVPRSCAVITNGNQDAVREASEMRGGFGFPRRSSSRPTCPKKSNSTHSLAGLSFRSLIVLAAAAAAKRVRARGDDRLLDGNDID
jgi:hypothetical protein